MKRAVVSVATHPYYRKGQARLLQAMSREPVHAPNTDVLAWACTPDGCPLHQVVPFAFKPHALKAAERKGFTSLLWCDASVLPIRSLAPVWEKIERDGYLIMDSGWDNYTWTADAAYSDLFGWLPFGDHEGARDVNKTISHVIAGVIGLDLRHKIACQFLDAYYRLSTTKAFCGPRINGPLIEGSTAYRQAPCGPADVRGHRHDQSAASVIAWRLDMKLVKPPEYFCYANEAGSTDPADYDERTSLIVHGGY